MRKFIVLPYERYTSQCRQTAPVDESVSVYRNGGSMAKPSHESTGVHRRRVRKSTKTVAPVTASKPSANQREGSRKMSTATTQRPPPPPPTAGELKKRARDTSKSWMRF